MFRWTFSTKIKTLDFNLKQISGIFFQLLQLSCELVSPLRFPRHSSQQASNVNEAHGIQGATLCDATAPESPTLISSEIPQSSVLLKWTGMKRFPFVKLGELLQTSALSLSHTHKHTYTHVSRQIRTRRNFKETRNRTRNFVWMNFTTTTTERNLLQVGDRERKSRAHSRVRERGTLAGCLSQWSTMERNGTAVSMPRPISP